jgi:predicted nucleic acid-binding protein
VTVVTDSGPLIALAKIGAIGILQDTYGTVLMPTAVYEEVVLNARAHLRADALKIRATVQQGHLAVVEVTDADLPHDVAVAQLDRGEKQTIHLALRERAGLLLIDDSHARNDARRRGLIVHGTLGAIVAAVRAKALDAADAELLVRSIQARHDIWIADVHCHRGIEHLRNL